MRYLFSIILFLGLTFGLWPYYHLYRLDRALVQNDQSALQVLVDLEAIRAARKLHPKPIKDLRGSVTQTLNHVTNVLTGTDGDNSINLEWVRETLRPVPARPDESYPSILHYTTCAFFENFRQFVARIRDLGDNPIHVRWTLRDWLWQVSAIYDY